MREKHDGWWYVLDSSGSGWGPVEGFYEYGNGPSSSIKCWEILEELSDWRLLKKGSAHFELVS
jgi:hypothetical protein